ncbi:MAG: hypothetical protein BRC29_03720 [Nanohaloarchaea archaeon SW_7_43_1]|nr:MAG: hypothetical protein BRC29_03720 [Nanohaloarchaea archaeon SW_7_43_1]
MSDWEVFQRDVLDVLRQYEGYFDFFERVGSLSDDSRPDCFGRICREEKKEIWVIDAKNKGEVDKEDLQRMQNYIEMLQANPIDAGLEISEISEYSFRGIFVTSSDSRVKEFESVAFNSLHQFLQKELVYTDTDRVVRDVSKMMERQELTQSQARLLFRSLKPYEDRFQQGIKLLKDIESDYIGLEVKEPPISSFDYSVPVDAVVTHEKREVAFLFDIPYSWDVVKSVDDKAEEIKEVLENIDKEVYYAAINTFGEHESEYFVKPEEIEREIRETAGVLSPSEVVDIFQPKIRTEKEFEDGEIRLKGEETDFRMAVSSRNDIRHRVEAVLPEKAANEIKNSFMNSHTDLGKVVDNRFVLEFEVTEDFGIRTDQEKSFKDFKDSVKSIFGSSVNPVLGKKVSARNSL